MNPYSDHTRLTSLAICEGDVSPFRDSVSAGVLVHSADIAGLDIAHALARYKGSAVAFDRRARFATVIEKKEKEVMKLPMKKWIEKGILSLMTGTMPVFIACAYGVPDDESQIRGSVKDASGKALANIKVSCLVGKKVASDTFSLEGDGVFWLYYDDGQPCDTLRFEDVDGEENGGEFQTKEIDYAEGDAPVVTLEKAE